MRICKCEIEVPSSLNNKSYSSFGLLFKLDDRVSLRRNGREYHIEQIYDSKVIIANDTRTLVKSVSLDVLYLVTQ